MRKNMLKLNSDKIEVCLSHISIMTSIWKTSPCVGDLNILSLRSVRNLGDIFGSAMNMEQPVGLAISNFATLSTLCVT